MFEYKRAVQAHIGPHVAALGKSVVARKLGLRPNFFTAILSDKDPYEVLPISYLPALVSFCGLSEEEGLRLLALRISDKSMGVYARHAKPRVGLDEPTLRWIISAARATA
jgi:hypothetical protein